MEQDGDKTHDPTAHRRQQAREQGQVAQSHDLSSGAVLLGTLVTLLIVGPSLAEFFADFTRHQLGGGMVDRAELPSLFRLWDRIVADLTRTVLPVLAVALVLTILTGLAQVGFLWLPEKLIPDLSRLDILKGLQRIASVNNLMRMFFSLLKLVLVGSVAYLCVAGELPTILSLVGLDIRPLAHYFVEMSLWTAIKIAAALLTLALADYAWHWWKLEQELKMTTQEMREEMKQLQGDPQIAARRRVVQRQLVLNRLAGAVPKADVVVTNPTELAIAIQYDVETMAAPIVAAKGAGILAQRIRKLALEHGVPIVENKPLAQSLYRDVDVGKPIPDKMYAAVAEVLAYVYQLKGKPLPQAPGGA